LERVKQHIKQATGLITLIFCFEVQFFEINPESTSYRRGQGNCARAKVLIGSLKDFGYSPNRESEVRS
jgi:hypothetical protein